MMNCSACMKLIKSSEGITCTRKSCVKQYHLLCVNITPDKLRSHKSWTCCKEPRQGDNSNTPLRRVDDSETPTDSDFENVTKRKPGKSSNNHPLVFNNQDSLRSELRLILKEELKQILSAELQPLKEKLTDLDTSLTFISSQYDEMTKLLMANKNELKCLSEENKSLREDLKTCASRIKQLETENMRQQQWSRLNNIEITGVPECKTTTDLEVVMKVAERIGAPVKAADVEFAHRIQPYRTGSAQHSRAIVARFKQRSTKDAVIAAARKIRYITAEAIGIGSINDKIYVNEHLTRTNKALLRECKQKSREMNYKFVWTKNCRIYIRKNESSPPIPITIQADLIKIT
ncbi:uncharacterized protein LOC128202085 [Galleria mellonella]|uniref:Uncharacterized protein LOC128202085 n=1 Tax=Galleria mellonella TaxID=7137 RepID=A0ABM3N0E9_GALME|nr:uncharacterized protein LOC128202085 [Galleria mellonella]